MYLVQGGHHEDFSFLDILKEHFECYGPFKTYDEALIVWKAKTWLNVDDGQHRLFIVPWKHPNDKSYIDEDGIRIPYKGWTPYK